MSISSQLLRQTLLITLLLAAPVFCLNPTADQWVPLPRFAGGINTQFDRSALPEGQLLAATNFIWRDGQLEGREGFQRFANPVSANGITFMSIFSNSQGADYLMYSDGVGLWYRPELTGSSVELNFGRSSSGTVDTYSGILQVRGNTIASQKWRTIFGTGEGLIITVDGVERTIDKIILDTLIFITADPGNEAAVTHSIDYSAIVINDALAVSDNYWIFSSAGKFYFNRPDSFVTIDSLTGLRFAYSIVNRLASSTGSGMGMQFTATGVTSNYAGQYARIVSNPVSTGMPKNPVDSGHHFYMSYPIYTSGSNLVKTYGMAFPPDTAAARYIAIEALTYDSTTKFTRTVDSVRVDTTDLHDAAGSQARYLHVWCDSCFFDSDTNSFITGDWFFAPNYTWTYPGGTLDGDDFQHGGGTFPVVGGYKHSDSSWLIACPPDFNDIPAWDIDSNNCSVIFFRMKKDVTGQRVGGYNFAVLHNERVFEVRADEPDRFYYSEPFYPDSFLAGSVTIVDPAHPCIAAAKQWSDLVVWTTAGSWRVIADATAENYTVEKMNTSKGCLSRGSFINIDNVHYGLAADGFWQCDGNEPQTISGAVSKYFTDSLSIEDYDDIRTGYDAENDNIWISSSRWTLVYHRATQSWWRQSFVAGAYAYNADVNVSDSVRFLVGERDSSTIFMRGGRTDDGTNVTASLQIPYLTLGDPVVAKRLKSLLMVYDSQVAAAVSVYGYRDYSLTPFDTVSFTSAATWSQKWLRFPDARYRGNNLSLGLSITNATHMKLPDMRIQIIPLGEED